MTNKIILTESQLFDYVGRRVLENLREHLQEVKSYSLNSSDLENTPMLCEWEYKTYSGDYVLNYLFTKCGGKFNELNCQKVDLDNCSAFIFILDKTEDISKLDKIMNALGYYRSFERDCEENTKMQKLQYEPRFSNNNTDGISRLGNLYHISPTKYKNKILKYGLIPKSQNNIFNYPNRVYFFSENFSDEDLIRYTVILALGIDQNVSLSHLNFENIETKWTYYTLDAKKITNNTRFYVDILFNAGAVYTYDNISPQAIVDSYDFDLNKCIDWDRLKKNIENNNNPFA